MKRHQKRVDGRTFETVRGISGKVGWLPRSHGSALFTRGETQAMVSCTLGTLDDGQTVEDLDSEYKQNFMLHYNFPPYSVGEARPIRAPGRREIGHGNLALRALQGVLPKVKEFPYTIRVISDISESNGSSSMATVCGGCLSMMDVGIPIHRPVAGVAMGLIQEDEEIMVLSDILGDEDHLGDMDFKVAGTTHGITAVQLDNKIGSLSNQVMSKALNQAKKARMHILKEMDKILDQPRKELSPLAPRCVSIKIRKERIRDLIGPGGKVIQEIQAKTGAKIDINSETGVVLTYAPNDQSCKQALQQINYFTKELEVGKIYRGSVVSVKDFGAFVRIYANTEGLVHISEIENHKIANIHDIVKAGQEMIVKVLGVDRNGKISLSRKEALNVAPEKVEN
jgi:polyribonucleotide nucleotidyltransferase